jgi:hypothetical protein
MVCDGLGQGGQNNELTAYEEVPELREEEQTQMESEATKL